jgi:ubiquinone/menaquinone biosynthesis C-methylase UbiE
MAMFGYAQTRDPDAGHVYTLGTNSAEQDRLRQQDADLRGQSLTLLSHVELEPGQRAIDLGCGPQGILDLLADRVGPGGHVVGLDAIPDHVALARAFVDQHALTNVHIVEGDARRTGLPAESFDLAHARRMLVNIPRPAEVVAEMVRLVRPGGWLACMEPDVIAVCHPQHSAWDRLCEVFFAVFHQDGADPRIGRSVAQMYRDAGLVDVGVQVQADAYPLGHPRRTVLLQHVKSLTRKILDRGLLDERELDDLHSAA